MPKYRFIKSRCGYAAGRVVDSGDIKPGLLKTLVRFGVAEKVKSTRKKTDAVNVDPEKDDKPNDLPGVG